MFLSFWIIFKKERLRFLCLIDILKRQIIIYILTGNLKEKNDEDFVKLNMKLKIYIISYQVTLIL